MMVIEAARNAAFPTPPASAAERLLADALAREMRAPQGRVAVVALLSRLPPPGAQPHHRRIARALLDACAQRHDGQVFQLHSGDLVLLARPHTPYPVDGRHQDRHSDEGDPGEGTPQALPRLLTRLLQGDGTAREGSAGEGSDNDMTAVAAGFPLAEGHDRLRGLLHPTGRPLRSLPGIDDDAPEKTPLPGRLPAGWRAADVAGLLQVQVGARLPAAGGVGVARILPVHRALFIAPGLLAARLAAHGGMPADPCLRQHLAIPLGHAVLALVRAAWGRGGPLDAAVRAGVAPLHLSLPLPVILSDGFSALAGLCHDAGTPARVVVDMAEACDNPASLARARGRVAAAGMSLVLAGVGHQALVLARPEALGADLVQVQWSAALTRLPQARRLEVAAAIGRVGRERVMLTGADSEAALHWGRAAGLHLFQGRHVEAMLAATRLLACPQAAACTLRQCAERASATQVPGRRDCDNPRLLDQAVPDTARAAA